MSSQYHVSLYAVIQAVQALETKSVNGTMKEETTFDGLKDNTTYWFRVAAENAIGPCPYSGYVQGTTLPNKWERSRTINCVTLVETYLCHRYSGCGI